MRALVIAICRGIYSPLPGDAGYKCRGGAAGGGVVYSEVRSISVHVCGSYQKLLSIGRDL
jgi:hypothetical protein